MAVSNKLSPTRGLHRVDRVDREYGIATKVTGRNLASVTYIVALEAERRGIDLELRTKFGVTGTLLGIEVFEGDDDYGTPIPPGSYLILEPDDTESVIVNPEDYQRYFRRVVE